MSRTTKAFSVSLNVAIADALERSAGKDGISASTKIAEIVEAYFLDPENRELADEAKTELRLLRQIRDEAIEKLIEIRCEHGFSPDITLRTFQACQKDADWLALYELYIQGNPLLPGNPRKTNANQTIGSRIKSKLAAADLCDSSGKLQRGRAPAGTIIQTYQLLRLP